MQNLTGLRVALRMNRRNWNRSGFLQ